jgi:uncharacterized protein (TIGR02246 family)
MRTHLFVGYLVVAVTLLFQGFCAAQTSHVTLSDQRALADLVQELDSAYDAQDVARFSALFTPDASFSYVIEGPELHGREEIRQHFARQFATLPPMLHVTKTKATNALAPGMLAVDFLLDILSVDPKTGLGQTLLVQYNGMGIGIQTDSGWHIRMVRLYRVSK